MRDFRDAKAMAQTLREALTARSVLLTHSESLELVAKIFGFRDWNVLSAKIQSHTQPGTAALAPSASANINLPLVPLREVVLFPQMISPLFIGREKTRRAVEHAMANDGRILAVTQRRLTDETLSSDALYGIGVTAKMLDLTSLGDGTMRGVIKGVERAAIVQFIEGDFQSAEIASVEEARRLDSDAFELVRTVLEKLDALPQTSYVRLMNIREPGAFADVVAPFLPAEIGQKQDLLEAGDVVTRLEKILAIVTTDRRAA
jgi:uncharacterized protein